jgi:hypothetical protein
MIKQPSTKIGVGAGGLILLITALTIYWRKYNETGKLSVLGISLAVVIYLSIRLYMVKSIADVFSFELGTKST